jgi:hypothetical protein
MAFLTLVLIELARSAKTHPAGLGALPAVISASFDQVPLKRGKASQDSHQQLTLRCRGIAPRIAQGILLYTGAFTA